MGNLHISSIERIERIQPEVMESKDSHLNSFLTHEETGNPKQNAFTPHTPPRKSPPGVAYECLDCKGMGKVALVFGQGKQHVYLRPFN
jgi:hypothetical protein